MASGPLVYRDRIRVRTAECLEFVDLTDTLAQAVARSSVSEGLLAAQSQHTTAALLVNEAEPLLIEDMKKRIESLAPRTAAYRHDDFSVRTVNMTPDEPANGHAHCKALFLPVSVTLNVVGGRLDLGRWQRVFLVELDAGRERTVSVRVLGF